MRSRWIFVVAAAGAIVACSAGPSADESASVASADTDVNVILVPPGTDNGYPEPNWAAVCPLTSCCSTVGRNFNAAPFEAQLAAWHCDAPKAYAPNFRAGPGHWWFFTYCPHKDDSGATIGGVDYATSAVYPGAMTSWVRHESTDPQRGWSDVAPIWSSYLRDSYGCIPPAPPGKTVVSFDPTCTNGCRIEAY